MPLERTALLSIRPRFAEALLDGSKTVEIRRRRANITSGSVCLVYATSPMRALVGAIRVQHTDTDTSDALWHRWGAQIGLERDEYDAYLANSSQPCAIVVDAATRFAGPVGLQELRRRQHAFVTPQSYRFLRNGELSSLLNGEASQLERLTAVAAQTEDVSWLAPIGRGAGEAARAP